MALDLSTLKAHCNVSGTDDDILLMQYLAASQRHVERLLGYALTDTDILPDGAPADLEQAVLMLAADWYENREATLVGGSAAAIQVPFGVSEIVNEHRNFTFGLCDE